MNTDNTSSSDEREYIEATVVAVINNREVILNVGEEDGVELGMRFVILGETEVESTRAQGGKIPVPFRKTEVKIVRFIDELHAVGRTFKTIPGRKARSLASFTVPGMFDETPDRVETVPVDRGTDLLSQLPPSAKNVKPGDRAEETWADEFAGPDD